MKQVKIIENVLKHNDEIAAMNRQRLRGAGVYCIDLIGAPGCGKTALLEATLQQLNGKLRVGIIAGDLATDRDARRIQAQGGSVVQVNTGKGCHLDANQVRHAIDNLNLAELDLLVIENVGNLICPVGFDLGQDCKVGMFSVCGGDDKPAKHPHLVVAADLLLLNKTDLLKHVRFDHDVFTHDIHTLNPAVELIELSVVEGNLDRWINWLTSKTQAARSTTGAVANVP